MKIPKTTSAEAVILSGSWLSRRLFRWSEGSPFGSLLPLRLWQGSSSSTTSWSPFSYTLRWGRLGMIQFCILNSAFCINSTSSSGRPMGLAAARSPSGENNALCCFLTPSGRFTTRCGSVTFGGKQRTVLFSNTLRPLHYSLRLGHTQGLTVHRTVIQYPRAATLPYNTSPSATPPPLLQGEANSAFCIFLLIG